MTTNTAESFRTAQDRKLNGPRGFKQTERSMPLIPYNPVVPVSTTYWRAAVDGSPGWNFKVTYHGR